MKLKLVFSLVATNFFAGCAFNVAQYGASVNNVESIRSAGIKPVSVSAFNSLEPEKSSINCRAAGPVSVKPTFASYIEKAFIDELKLAGAYDPMSNLVIKGTLEEIDFSSGITDGKWLFTLSLTNSRGESYTTKSIYNFSGSFIADRACQETAQAFAPAVQKLVQDMVANSQFKKIAN